MDSARKPSQNSSVFVLVLILLVCFATLSSIAQSARLELGSNSANNKWRNAALPNYWLWANNKNGEYINSAINEAYLEALRNVVKSTQLKPKQKQSNNVLTAQQAARQERILKQALANTTPIELNSASRTQLGRTTPDWQFPRKSNYNKNTNFESIWLRPVRMVDHL